MSGLFWNDYPYTDFHELNLTWLIKKMIELNETVKNFVSLNTIKYADPIQWNITTQYEKNTVVIDPNTGKAYLSVQPVPSGVGLTNTDYWTLIFDLDITTANNNITLRDDGNNIVASFDSVAGDWLLWNGILYRVTRNIDIADAYVVGYNLERYTVEDFVRNYIGDLSALTTDAKNNLVSAINELDAHDDANTARIGNLADLTTDAKNNLVSAVNEVDAHVDTNTNHIGNLTLLDTDDQGNLVGAVNEVNAHTDTNTNHIGNLTLLTTEDKGNLVGAINEVNEEVGKTDYLNYFKGKKVLILGDSISDQSIGFPSCLPNWVDKFEDSLAGVATVTNNSVSGRKMVDLPGVINTIGSTQIKEYDIFIIFLGVNDFANSVTLGGFQTAGTFNNAIRESFEAIANPFTNTGRIPQIFFISPLYRDNTAVNSLGAPLYFYRAAIMEFCKRWNCYFINGDGIMYQNEIIDYLGQFYYDDIHPNSIFATYMNDYFIRKIVSLGDNIGSWVGKLVTPINSYATSDFSPTYCKMFIDADQYLHIKGHGTLNVGSIRNIISGLGILATGYVEDQYSAMNIFSSSAIVPAIVFRQSDGISVNCVPLSGSLPASGTISFDLKLRPNWLYWDRLE